MKYTKLLTTKALTFLCMISIFTFVLASDSTGYFGVNYAMATGDSDSDSDSDSDPDEGFFAPSPLAPYLAAIDRELQRAKDKHAGFEFFLASILQQAFFRQSRTDRDWSGASLAIVTTRTIAIAAQKELLKEIAELEALRDEVVEVMAKLDRR